MKLAELEPWLLKIEPSGAYKNVEALAEAQGIMFECPVCRSHSVLVWFRDRRVPAGEEPLPRWAVSGTSLEDLTISPSVNVAGCWHGFVVRGEVSSL